LHNPCGLYFFWFFLKIQLILFVEDRNWNYIRYHIDLEKLKALGWSPKVSFSEELKHTIVWYADNPDLFGNITAALVPHPHAGIADEPSFQCSS
jgi:dTDP-D-glucose 4,6-dehydratase